MKHTPFFACIAAACRLDEKSVRIFGRDLRDAGMLSTGARGPYAPDMTPHDLATMLLALLATDRPSKSPDLVAYIGAMQLAAPDMWQANPPLPSDPDHTLHELLDLFCDPAVQVPGDIRIKVHGTTGVTVENEAVEYELRDGKLGVMSFEYIDRAAMQRAGDGTFTENDVDRMSQHGITTTREIAAPSIELMKAVIFADQRAEHVPDDAGDARQQA